MRVFRLVYNYCTSVQPSGRNQVTTQRVSKNRTGGGSGGTSGKFNKFNVIIRSS